MEIVQKQIDAYARILTNACKYDIIGPSHGKMCFRGFANNKDADQPAHPHSLISSFVIRLLKSIIII